MVATKRQLPTRSLKDETIGLDSTSSVQPQPIGSARSIPGSKVVGKLALEKLPSIFPDHPNPGSGLGFVKIGCHRLVLEEIQFCRVLPAFLTDLRKQCHDKIVNLAMQDIPYVAGQKNRTIQQNGTEEFERFKDYDSLSFCSFYILKNIGLKGWALPRVAKCITWACQSLR